MDDVVRVREHGGPARAVPLLPGDTLAQALFRAGCFAGRPLCSGIGRCGACRVRFASSAPPPVPQDARRLSPAELADGWRLSCAHPAAAAAGAEIEVPSAAAGPHPSVPAAGRAPAEAGAAGAGFSLGLDLGTTGLAFRAVPASGRGRAIEGQAHNPQLGAGSEVMSRLAFAARGGADYLRDLILDFLRRVIRDLPGPVLRLGVAGNPAMIHLLLGLDFSGLAAAPYRLAFAGGREMELAPDLPWAYVPPLFGPFVGADASAGLFAVVRSGAKPPFVLVDLGTNGEFVLGLPDGRFLAASVPMGPALEGVGPRQGRLAGPGTAVAFELSPAGLSPVPFEGGEAAVTAIGGTGYLSLLARLRAAGVLCEDGRFADPARASPLGRRILAGLRDDAGEPRLDVAGVSLWAASGGVPQGQGRLKSGLFRDVPGRRDRPRGSFGHITWPGPSAATWTRGPGGLGVLPRPARPVPTRGQLLPFRGVPLLSDQAARRGDPSRPAGGPRWSICGVPGVREFAGAFVKRIGVSLCRLCRPAGKKRRGFKRRPRVAGGRVAPRKTAARANASGWPRRVRGRSGRSPRPRSTDRGRSGGPRRRRPAAPGRGPRPPTPPWPGPGLGRLFPAPGPRPRPFWPTTSWCSAGPAPAGLPRPRPAFGHPSLSAP
jgi:ferredoxin